ncbi:MAG: hypothetical protein ABIK92_21860 [Pseudomonadota bacterium]
MKVERIEVYWHNLKSIKAGERKQERLVNDGWNFWKSLPGFFRTIDLYKMGDEKSK